MAQASGAEPVRITANERPHPAVRSLARASILLARLRAQAELDASSVTATAVTAASDEESEANHG